MKGILKRSERYGKGKASRVKVLGHFETWKMSSKVLIGTCLKCGVGLTKTLAEAEATPQLTAVVGTQLGHWFGGECSRGHHNPFHLSPLYPSHFLLKMLHHLNFIFMFLFIYLEFTFYPGVKKQWEIIISMTMTIFSFIRSSIYIFHALHAKTCAYVILLLFFITLNCKL